MNKKSEVKMMNPLLKGITRSTAMAVFLIIIVLAVIVHIATGNFFTPYNLSTLLRHVSFTIIVAFGQTLVLLTGGIDLSVASLGSICSMVGALMMTSYGINPAIAIPVASLMGLGLGAINGALISSFSLTPFIVTLATSEIFKGIVVIVTQGMPIIGVPDAAANFVNDMIGGIIPNILVIMLVIFVILTLMLKFTTFGRHIYAIGGNKTAARMVGVRVKRVELGVYALSGLLSAMAGVFTMCRLASFQSSIGENWVMPSVTAAVLGGTSMVGGCGGVGWTIIGGMMMGVISVSITLMSIDSAWETVVTGGVVLIAVLIDALRQRSQKA